MRPSFLLFDGRREITLTERWVDEEEERAYNTDVYTYSLEVYTDLEKNRKEKILTFSQGYRSYEMQRTWAVENWGRMFRKILSDQTKEQMKGEIEQLEEGKREKQTLLYRSLLEFCSRMNSFCKSSQYVLKRALDRLEIEGRFFIGSSNSEEFFDEIVEID